MPDDINSVVDTMVFSYFVDKALFRTPFVRFHKSRTMLHMCGCVTINSQSITEAISLCKQHRTNLYNYASRRFDVFFDLQLKDDYFKYMIGIENGKLDSNMTWRMYNRLGKVSLFQRLIRKLIGLFT